MVNISLKIYNKMFSSCSVEYQNSLYFPFDFWFSEEKEMGHKNPSCLSGGGECYTETDCSFSIFFFPEVVESSCFQWSGCELSCLIQMTMNQ